MESWCDTDTEEEIPTMTVYKEGLLWYARARRQRRETAPQWPSLALVLPVVVEGFRRLCLFFVRPWWGGLNARPVLPVKRPGTSLGRKQVESDRVPCSGRRDKGGQGRDGFYNDDDVGEREK